MYDYGTDSFIVDDWNGKEHLKSEFEAMGCEWYVLRHHRNGEVSIRESNMPKSAWPPVMWLAGRDPEFPPELIT